MSLIAIIPARGGSKRIPRKNIIDFEGRPLICWTIKAAQDCGIFDRIVVSTDDPEIAEISSKEGVEVPFLRLEAADDISPISLATISAIKQAKEFWSESYDNVIQLMPSCPLRGASDILEAYNFFKTNGSNFQVSSFKFGWMNAWWASKLDRSFKPEYLFPDAFKSRSQDLPELYCPTGAIWIAKVSELLKSQTFYGEGHTFYPLDWRFSVDIDTEEDLQFAKILFRFIASQVDYK